MQRFSFFRTAALLAALALVLPACDSGTTEPPSTDTILFGVNYTRLFAPATPAEVAAVRADWSGRNPTSTTPEVMGTATVGDATVTIVRHDVTAAGCGTVTHYAAVRVPNGLTAPAPLLVVHHGGDSGFNVGETAAETNANTSLVKMVDAFPDLFAATVQVLPVYRSEQLRTSGFAALGGPYVAGGTESPWDCDVDDAIATVAAVIAAFPDAIDGTRRAAMGFSRGGNTAALHAIRDSEMDALVDYYGPTDFYNSSAQTLATGVLSGNAGALGLPGAQYLLDTVLSPLRGTTPDYGGARLEIARRSASLFTSSLPPTQIHHNYRDGVVPFTFSSTFDAAATANGDDADVELFPYGTQPTSATDVDPALHRPEANPESLPRVQTFLMAQLGL